VIIYHNYEVRTCLKTNRIESDLHNFIRTKPMRSKHFCVLLLMFWSFPLSAQNIDSLVQLLSHKEASEQEQYNTIQELLTSNAYISKNSTRASALAEEQYSIAQRMGVSSDIEKALYNKIRVSIIAQNHTQCLEEIELYLKLNNPRLGKYSQAIDAYESLLLKTDTIQDFNCEKAILNTNIGNVYYSLNDLEKALSRYESSIRYQKECGGEERIILKVANLEILVNYI